MIPTLSLPSIPGLDVLPALRGLPQPPEEVDLFPAFRGAEDTLSSHGKVRRGAG